MSLRAQVEVAYLLNCRSFQASSMIAKPIAKTTTPARLIIVLCSLRQTA